MKKILLITCTFLLTGSLFSQGTWVKKADLPGAKRSGAVAFSIGDKGYLGTGSGNGLSGFYSDLWEWDQASDTWTQKANFPDTARSYAVAFSLGSKGYVGTGYNYNVGGYYIDFWEYDPALNIWTQKANLPGPTRAGATAFAIGNKGYVTTGSGHPVFYNDLFEYDAASNTWTQKANLPVPGWAFAAAFSIGHKGYICSGTGANIVYNHMWEWDQISNSWTQKANLPSIKRDDAIGFSIGNYGYVGLGDSLNFQTGKWLPLSDFWKYNPFTNSWTQMANYGGGPVARPTAFVIGCRGYVATGWSGTANNFTGVRNDLWEFSDSPLTTSAPVITNVDCFGNNTGSASVNVTNGIPAYTYLWSTIPVQTTQAITGLFAGTYVLTVKDSAGCSHVDTVAIASPTGLTALPPAATNLNCFGTSIGSATVAATGGTPAYTYTWNPTSQTNATASGLAAGIYTITVTDNNGCIVNTLAQVTQPSAVTTTISADTSICFGTSATNIVIASGGTPGYSYLWMSGGGTATSITVSPSATTTYSVQVTDANGCSAQAAITTVTVVPNPEPNIAYTADLCAGSVQFTDSSANTVIWGWDFGDGGTSTLQQPSHGYPSAGSYSVMITLSGSLGCKTIEQLLVEVPAFSQLYIPNAFSPNNDNNNDIYFISGKCITQMTLSIYNRWGEKVFETSDQTVGWDGTHKGDKQNAGVYMYSFSGTLTTGEKIEQKGNITLMR